jgi:hypothetical protein
VRPEYRRALQALGVTVLVALLVVLLVAGSSEQQRLDRAERAEVSQSRNLDLARRAVTKERDALRAAYALAEKLLKELEAGNADVATTQAELGVATTALDEARVVLESQSSRRAVVQQCLDGVKRALDATRAGDQPAATAFLRAAAPSCSTALTPAGEAAPVLAFDFADPYVLRVGGEYFAYATNAAGGSVQLARSPDLGSWNLVGDALRGLPSWAVRGSIWAPAAMVRGPITVLYYTVREASSGRQCISAAISGAPQGPFLDGSTGPMECSENGAIDPSPFLDANGNPYLLYKTERPARIWSRPLTPDGRAFSGPGSPVLSPTQRWEAGNVEAPSMLRNGSTYWLFYSGNDWNGRNYAEGVALCAGPTGPCNAVPGNPILTSRGSAAGPGGGEVFIDEDGGWRLAYHAYLEPHVRYPNSRLLYFARIGLSSAGVPTVNP